MDVKEDVTTPLSNFKHLSLHAVDLNVDGLRDLASTPPTDSSSYATADFDDILPSESFSTQPSPTGSLLDSQAYRKPPISILTSRHKDDDDVKSVSQNSSLVQSDVCAVRRLPSNPSGEIDDAVSTKTLTAGIPSLPATAVDDCHRRSKSDILSDVEPSPRLKTAGFYADEIPRLDPLDPDGEWCDLRELAEERARAPRVKLNESAGNEGGEREGEATRFTEDKKRKKKRKKTKGVRGAKLAKKAEGELITGFEEYFAEAPLRPEEAEEEKAMYDPKFSVATYVTQSTQSLLLLPTRVRPILTAGSRAERVVQRYRVARRFNSDRERIFSAYLTFGGVRTVLPISYV